MNTENHTTTFSASETSKILGVSKTSLWRWRKKGIGPKWVMVANRIQYEKEDVYKWRFANG